MLFFGYIFAVFTDLYAQRGHRGEGRLKEGEGGGLIDLKFETPQGGLKSM